MQHSDEKSAALITNYVDKYWHDMLQHLLSIRNSLSDQARVHYVIGNAFYYGHEVASDQIMAALLEISGFHAIESKLIRRRSSSNKLYEYVISATLST